MTPELYTIIAANVLECICAALNANDPECGCPCRTCVVVGPPAWDDCCEGQLTISIDRIYAHDNFPFAAQGPIFCQAPLAAQMSILLLRCAPTLHDDGSPPSCPELEAAATKLYTEAYVILAGLICCLQALRREQKFVINDQIFVGPQGGCMGVKTTFTIELTDPPAF